jgi:ribosomal subunit interface protein
MGSKIVPSGKKRLADRVRVVLYNLPKCAVGGCPYAIKGLFCGHLAERMLKNGRISARKDVAQFESLTYCRRRMNLLFTITGKHIEITEALKAHAEEKTSKLNKYYDRLSQVEVLVDGQAGRNSGVNIGVEIIARGEHSNIFVVTETGEDAYSCIDIAVHKMERQLRKKKEKQRDNKHAAGEPQ